MSSWSELLDHAESEEHLVQLYGEDDQLLTRNVSRYLAEGLKGGDGLVVISTKAHAESFNRQLNEECAAASEALRDGRLVFFDAQTTLDRFMVDGQPNHKSVSKCRDGHTERGAQALVQRTHSGIR